MARDKKSPRKITFVTLLQSLYLTGNFFITNDLISYASACAFSFLFSFIPIVMLILVLLIRVFHAAPETVSQIILSNVALQNFFNIESFSNSLLQIHTITNFEIVLGISIIWMARRFFSSVVGGMNKIYGAELKSRPILSQVFVLAGEAILVIAIAILVVATITIRTVSRSSAVVNALYQWFPKTMAALTSNAVNMTPLVLMFIAITAVYKLVTRAHPSLFMSALASAGCTLVFAAFRSLMGLFININRYNLIYGVLSNAIVLLMEMFFFFVIFLFFAQWLFVSTFFETLLLSELYLLPDHDDTRLLASIRRVLFINPDFIMRRRKRVISFSKGERIYSTGDEGSDAYYLVQGTVQVFRSNHCTFMDKGKIFGEEACILNDVRNEDATALTGVKLVRITEEELFSILEKNPAASKKALSKIGNYFAKFYSGISE